MADKLDDEAEFWLPSEFLTDEDILMDNKVNACDSFGLCLPTQFPYDYDTSVLGSPVESVVCSTETESDEEDLLLTGLTRQLTLHETQKLSPTLQIHEKPWLLSGSPQSTLSHVGSWSGRSTMSSNGSPNGPSQVSSPPTTPFVVNNDAWDLINQAAGQVARLKISGGGDGPTRNSGFLGPPRNLTTPPLGNSSYSGFSHSQLQQKSRVEQEACGIWSRQFENGWSFDSHYGWQNMGGKTGMGFGSRMDGGGGGGIGQSLCAWPSQQVQKRNLPQNGELGLNGGAHSGGAYGYGYGYGSGGGGGGGGNGALNKVRAGTGVFLPRRYDNHSFKRSEYRKKPGCSTTAWLPNKVSQTFNKNFDEIPTTVKPKSRCNGGFMGDNYDALLARKIALLAQQSRTLCSEGISQEICLPQEWTY